MPFKTCFCSVEQFPNRPLGLSTKSLPCQIRTNLANRLNALGRPVAANEQWLEVLAAEPHFAKALANRAKGIAFYATTLYDKGHEVCLLAAARTIFDAALSTDALWESGDRDAFAPSLADRRDSIQAHLVDVAYDEDFDFNQFTLGATEEERSYRRWCLRERLFLNPLNDQFTESVAAADVLHLPDHTYKIGESPSISCVLQPAKTGIRKRPIPTLPRDSPTRPGFHNA